MKYIAVIDTDDYEDFEFFEDGNGKYLAEQQKQDFLPTFGKHLKWQSMH